MSATTTRHSTRIDAKGRAYVDALRKNPFAVDILDAHLTVRMLLAGPASMGNAGPVGFIDNAIEALQRARARLVGG